MELTAGAGVSVHVWWCKCERARENKCTPAGVCVCVSENVDWICEKKLFTHGITSERKEWF